MVICCKTGLMDGCKFMARNPWGFAGFSTIARLKVHSTGLDFTGIYLTSSKLNNKLLTLIILYLSKSGSNKPSFIHLGLLNLRKLNNSLYQP
jgi:hypothetical protein